MIDRIAQLEQQYASAKNNATALRDAWHQATWNVSQEEAEPLRKAADEASKAATECWIELQTAKVKSTDVAALSRMSAAEDDDGEACLAMSDTPIDTSGANWRLRKATDLASPHDIDLADYHRRLRQGKTSDVIALAKMASAEDDDGESCLDSAGQSHNGDEFESPVDWMHPETARLSDEDLAFERDLMDTKAAADEALLDIADFLLAGNSTWRAAKRMHRSIEQFAESYT